MLCSARICTKSVISSSFSMILSSLFWLSDSPSFYPSHYSLSHHGVVTWLTTPWSIRHGCKAPKKTAERRSTLLFSIINEEQLGRLAPKPEQAHWDPLSVVTHPQTFYCVIVNSLFRPLHGEIPLSGAAALQLSWKPRDASKPVGDTQCSGMHWPFCNSSCCFRCYILSN